MPTREQRARKLGIPINQLPDGRGKNSASWNNTKRGREHHRWSNGRILNEDGYVKVRVGKDHPLADPNGYAYEHLVVWCAAGRPRPSNEETLHHKNENKADNRLENLEIMTRAEHNSHHIAERGRRSNGQFSANNEISGRLLSIWRNLEQLGHDDPRRRGTTRQEDESLQPPSP